VVNGPLPVVAGLCPALRPSDMPDAARPQTLGEQVVAGAQAGGGPWTTDTRPLAEWSMAGDQQAIIQDHANRAWSGQNLIGRLTASLGPVKVRVETDDSKPVALRCDVLLGIVKVQSKPLHNVHNGFDVLWLKMNEGNGSFNKGIANES